MNALSQDQLHHLLDQVGQSKESDIHLTDSALAMAALESSAISIERYQHHIKKMVEEVAERHCALLAEGAEDNAQTQLASLKYVISDTHGYEGDNENYDDLQNVNLIRVIERRKAMPIAISLLYVHVGLAQGWDVASLNFPAHVVCRIDKDGQRVLFAPFNKCQMLQASDLRRLLKERLSPEAELAVEYYEPATKRDMLIRMQNNIKRRQIEGEDYLGALRTIEIMRRIDPDEYRLLLDAGVLYARTNQALAAVDALEKYIDLAPSKTDQHDALLLLQQIRADLS